MLATIVSEIPGRMRLRCACGPLDADEARAISVGLLGVGGVEHVEVHRANASVLVVMDPAARDEAVAYVRSLDVLSLPSVPTDSLDVPHELAMVEEDQRFVGELARLAAGKLFRRALLPAWVRAAWTCLQAVGFVAKGLRRLLHREVTVEVLDAAAIITALLRRSFAEADTIMFLLRVSDAMERHVQSRVSLALGEGIVARAAEVWRVEDGQDVRVAMDEVRVGDVLRLGAGSVLPVDGTVVVGEGEINEASMTGEAQLVHKREGSTVYAGTALESGSLEVRVVAPPGRARIDQIVRVVRDSSSLKAQTQSRAERLADGLVPYSFLAFFAILAVTRNPTKAAAVLMVDYSCAIKLSTPIAIMSALREASEMGAVVKGGKYLEALAAADTIVFDKTGTLTTATPHVVRVLPFGNMEPDEVLRYAACIEEHYPHSVARAIVAAASERGLEHRDELHAKVNYVVAHGVSTQVGGRSACIGSRHFVFEDEGVPEPAGMRELIAREAPAASAIYLAIDGRLEGAICIFDPPRPEAAFTLRALRERGIEHVVMLTGDSQTAAASVAAQLGIAEYRAQVLPEDKGTYVSDLRANGHVVAMVGDGINDSPALAAANVSIALADASDIARAVADIAVDGSSLDALVSVRDLSSALMRRIRTRYQLIVLVNSSLIALGVAGVISLTTAAYVHNATTAVITALNTRPLMRRGS